MIVNRELVMNEAKLASRADLIPAVKEFNALKKELNNRTAKPTDYQRKRKVFIREKVHYLGKK